MFAAGADIKEMKDLSYTDAFNKKFLQAWDAISTINKPIIAAVNGYALGGGFELALMCDLIVASKSAKFGLPELKLGTIPGMGGTQRLIREIGKSRAMKHILTSEFISAEQALQYGLLADLTEEDALKQALSLAEKMNTHS